MVANSCLQAEAFPGLNVLQWACDKETRRAARRAQMSPAILETLIKADSM
jgi:hypothetical protein